ncbi:hypothetical protein SAMN04515671_0825 [Nakamurella panacisegetis]|uniref:Uncharacterized protein n=1 Tax=Nakamurella panacisegetis TaxID=1090615 RepID=A0A1H0J9J8_9ACTN|nr:hypothetical protein [Nakamurella panacisegetis]SDO40183.1 hypothetical protein SAMN04515671_0825 [Nakamurella panacisegetis]
MGRHPHPHLAQIDEFGPEGRRSAHDKRRFGVVLLGLIALLILIGAAVISVVTDIPLQWDQLLWALVLVLIGYGTFLWVRLTR